VADREIARKKNHAGGVGVGEANSAVVRERHRLGMTQEGAGMKAEK
jgi:hypothetical protein